MLVCTLTSVAVALKATASVGMLEGVPRKAVAGLASLAALRKQAGVETESRAMRRFPGWVDSLEEVGETCLGRDPQRSFLQPLTLNSSRLSFPFLALSSIAGTAKVGAIALAIAKLARIRTNGNRCFMRFKAASQQRNKRKHCSRDSYRQRYNITQVLLL